MTLHRFAAKRDSHERAIVQTLRACGYAVERVSGAGFPDLVVTRHGQVWFVEVKTATGRLTPTQHHFRERWQGPGIFILRSVEDVLAWAQSGDRLKDRAA